MSLHSRAIGIVVLGACLAPTAPAIAQEASVSVEATAVPDAGQAMPPEPIAEVEPAPAVQPPTPAESAETLPEPTTPEPTAAIEPASTAELATLVGDLAAAETAAVAAVTSELRHRAEAPENARERRSADSDDKLARGVGGACRFEPHPDACATATRNSAIRRLCSEEADPQACRQEALAHPCVERPGSPDCSAYLVSRPCIADPASFECRRWSAMRSIYCSVRSDQFNCGGQGGGSREFTRPGIGGGVARLGLADPGAAGDLLPVLEVPTATRPVRSRLPFTGFEAALLVLLGVSLITAGCAGRAIRPG
ncbi:MAG: hypothetical protein ACR2G3_12135 [Solirubrobacterales bacterium]